MEFRAVFGQTYSQRYRFFQALLDAGAGTAFEAALIAVERIDAPERFKPDQELMVRTLTEQVDTDHEVRGAAEEEDLAAFTVANARLGALAFFMATQLAEPVCRATGAEDIPFSLCSSNEQVPGGEYGAELKIALDRFAAGFFARIINFGPVYETADIIATEALDANLLGHLAPGRRMMVETRARHSYFRISPDGTRILFGGRAAMVDVDMAKAARRQFETMCEVWPELRDVKLSHVWTGNTGYSFSHAPNVGADNGLHHAMGFSGSGTVMAPYLGAKAAYQAMGDARGETAFSHTAFNGYWAHPFAKPHFLKAADIWYRNFVDRKESWQSR